MGPKQKTLHQFRARIYVGQRMGSALTAGLAHRAGHPHLLPVHGPGPPTLLGYDAHLLRSGVGHISVPGARYQEGADQLYIYVRKALRPSENNLAYDRSQVGDRFRRKAVVSK